MIVASLLLASLLLFPAFAGVPVVTDAADHAAALAAVAARSGLPADQLEAVSLKIVLDSPPQALGQAVLRRCTSETTTMEAVRADLMRAEAAWLKRERVEAFDHLDLAVAHLGCLGERVDGPSAGRVFLLRGSLEAERGQSEAARGELRTALAFDRELGWTSSFPLEGQVLLAEERAVAPGLRVQVLPSGMISGPWVDGQALEGADAHALVAPGLHLAQHSTPAGIRSAWMVVGGDTTLVLPASYRRPVLSTLRDQASRGPTLALLEATLDGAPAAYVLDEGWMWLLTFGAEPGVELLVEPGPPQPDPGGGKKKKKDKKDKKQRSKG